LGLLLVSRIAIEMTLPLRKTGIALVGDMPWGTHFCHFFETKKDLLDTVLPYFKAGLEAGEMCLWVLPEPLTPDEAMKALRRGIPRLERYLDDRSIEIHRHRDWYYDAGDFDAAKVTSAWDEKLSEALARGFAGLRVNGTAAWLANGDWGSFREYEEKIDGSMAGKRMIALCTYPLSNSPGNQVLDVARTHQFVVAKRNGRSEYVEAPELRQAKSEIRRLNRTLQQRVAKRTADLVAVNAELTRAMAEQRRVDEDLRARNRQQAAVAKLGQLAIRTSDMAALLEEAVAVAAATLGTEHSAVLEARAGGETLFLRAGVGWGEGVVGQHTVMAGITSAARFTLQSDEPVIVPDLPTETRFVRPPFLLQYGIRSIMSVIIRGPSRPWGVLGVAATRLRSFSPDDIGFLQSVANVLALSLERNEMAAAQAREKETLQAIFDNIPVMISAYDAEGRLLRVNGEWERTLGWTLEEARRLDILAECYPDPQRRQEVFDFIRTANRQWADFGTRTRSGRVIETSWTRFPLSDGSRLGIGIDITQRKRAEGERDHLLESETRARAEAEAALERLRAIDTITDSALVHLGMDDLLRELLVRLQRVLDADSIGVQLLDEDGQALYTRAAVGFTHPNFASIRVRVGRGVTGRIAAEGRPLIVDDYSTVDSSGIEGIDPSAVRATTQSVMGAPLRIGQRVVGVVSVVSSRPRRFTEEELKLLLLVADRAAPAVELARLLEKLRAGRETQRALSRRLLTAQEEERRHLAIELHDELGQVLTAAQINLGFLERMSGAATPPTHLRDAIASVDEAMHRVRDLALDLRPSVLDDLGLSAALRWYGDRFARRAQVEVRVAVDPVPPLEAELETACFRVAQEALTNVARHAQARRAWLDLKVLPEGIELAVRDDGIGFDVASARERASGGTSMGLLGMQERVSLVGGEFELLSVPGSGTEVRARFAVGEKARRAVR
jgi:PAS domain S-box-containing protein